jgi:DNA polymerase-3 subunit epsilon
MEKRDLTTAYRYFCGKNLEDAHTSDADTLATYEVFMAQMEKYDELKDMSVEDVHNFCNTDNRVDVAGKILKNENGEFVFGFGKHQGKSVTGSDDGISYAKWMLAQNFTSNTKSVLTKILADAEKITKFS